jgi:single-strand DNA-binding protein
MLNQVTLIGNAGNDPEVRTLESGQKVARFSLATSKSHKDKEGNWQTNTQWHTVVCWGYLAERAEEKVKKGRPVFVSGEINYRKYKDKDGIERTAVEIQALDLDAFVRIEKTTTSEPKQEATSRQPQPPAPNFENPDGDDLPF